MTAKQIWQIPDIDEPSLVEIMAYRSKFIR
jgi:hypothetical protein